MTDVILTTLPVMLGAALAPIWIILVVLLLRDPNGLTKGIAFVAGATTVRLGQGIMFGYLFAAFSPAEETQDFSVVVSTLLIVGGILLLIVTLKAFRQTSDPDAPPLRWMVVMDSANALTVFGLGAVLTLAATKFWVLTLLAISIICEADLNRLESITAFLIYVLGTEVLILIPLVVYAIVPRQSAALLRSIAHWLEQYDHPITIAVSFTFGSLFLWQGVMGFMA
ncbi:MAG: hypothetical protein Kow00121_15980 [Elainellaceae cyanobacterium]